MKPETAKIIEAATELLRVCGYFVDKLWHVDDIHFICEQLEILPVSDQEAMEVFAIASEAFDGDTGISWPKLEEAVKILLKRKEALARASDDICFTT